MTEAARLRHRVTVKRARPKPAPPPPAPHPIIAELERQRRERATWPLYRIELTVESTGYAEWRTLGDPDEETEDDDAAQDLIEQVLDGGDDVDVRDWGRVEQWYPEPTEANPRAGRWGKVNHGAIERRRQEARAHLEVCASVGPPVSGEIPRCMLPLGHSGYHRPLPEGGWPYGMTWGDPTDYDLQFREECRRDGEAPIDDPYEGGRRG